MINTPKDLSDIEVGLYKSGYGFCEKLVKDGLNFGSCLSSSHQVLSSRFGSHTPIEGSV